MWHFDKMPTTYITLSFVFYAFPVRQKNVAAKMLCDVKWQTSMFRAFRSNNGNKNSRFKWYILLFAHMSVLFCCEK